MHGRKQSPLMLFRNDFVGHRRVGRSKTRWFESVEKDLQTLRIRNWQSVARDRMRWIRVLKQAKAHKWR